MTDIARVRATINYGQGGPGLGTFYFSFLGITPTAPELADAVARVRAFYFALAAVLCTTVTVLVQGAVETIEEETGVLTGAYTTTPPAAVVGTGATPQMAPHVSLVVRLVTQQVVNGRILQGRTYVGPLSSVTGTNTGTPSTGSGTAALAAIVALLSTTSTEEPVIWHRPKAAGSGTSGTIVGGSAWSSFGSLRSRRD